MYCSTKIRTRREQTRKKQRNQSTKKAEARRGKAPRAETRRQQYFEADVRDSNRNMLHFCVCIQLPFKNCYTVTICCIFIFFIEYFY